MFYFYFSLLVFAEPFFSVTSPSGPSCDPVARCNHLVNNTPLLGGSRYLQLVHILGGYGNLRMPSLLCIRPRKRKARLGDFPPLPNLHSSRSPSNDDPNSARSIAGKGSCPRKTRPENSHDKRRRRRSGSQACRRERTPRKPLSIRDAAAFGRPAACRMRRGRSDRTSAREAAAGLFARKKRPLRFVSRTRGSLRGHRAQEWVRAVGRALSSSRGGSELHAVAAESSSKTGTGGKRLDQTRRRAAA